MRTTPTLRAALVGAGAIAREHLPVIAEHPGVELVAVCDRSPTLAHAACEQFGAKTWYTDFGVMLAESEPDVVHITTPASSHVALAREALASPAHVIVEKPIAPSVSELDGLIALAEREQRLLIENQNYLFNRTVQDVLRRVAGGAIGEVVHVSVRLDLALLGEGSRFNDRNAPHPAMQERGGIASDFLPHLCGLVCVFAGAMQQVQTSWRDRAGLGVPDELYALVEAEQAMADMVFSVHGQPDRFELVVTGDQGRLTTSLYDPLLARQDGGNGPAPALMNRLRLAWGHTWAGLGGLWTKLAGRPVGYEGVRRHLEQVYAAIADGGVAPLSIDHLRATRRLVDAVTEQAPCAS